MKSASSYVDNFFQLTTSHGGRPGRRCSCYGGLPFNSRPHTEVDEDLPPELPKTLTFQLTTSHGGRPSDGIVTSTVPDLSTHDLTRRSTVIRSVVSVFIYLSTHDLTRRSTYQNSGLSPAPLLSTHDLTRRSTSHQCIQCRQMKLSTHDLTRRSTKYVIDIEYVCISFNSRPHTEVDCAQIFLLYISRSFNSRPHTEVDGLFGITGQRCRPFNSRPHTEVDRPVFRNRGIPFILSTHDLTRRSTLIACTRDICASLSTHDLTRRSTRAHSACP